MHSRVIVGAALAVLLLAGCGGSPSAPAPQANGIDDGTAVYRLTAGDAPLTAGANRPSSWSGAGKAAALSHPDAAAGEAAKG